MKKIIAFVYALILVLGARAAPDRNLSEKILRIFRESFPDARQICWKESLASYTIDFFENDVRVHIVYAKNGDFFRSMRFYDGQDLPFYLQKIIRKKYPKHRLLGVVEVADARGVNYLLKTGDGKILTTIKMGSDGVLDLIEK
jgi:hypothetical protein